MNSSYENEEDNPIKLILEDKGDFIDFVKRQKKTQFWLPIHKHGTSEYWTSAPVPRKSVLLWAECCLPGKEKFKVRITISNAILGTGRKTMFIHPY